MCDVSQRLWKSVNKSNVQDFPLDYNVKEEVRMSAAKSR